MKIDHGEVPKRIGSLTGACEINSPPRMHGSLVTMPPPPPKPKLARRLSCYNQKSCFFFADQNLAQATQHWFGGEGGIAIHEPRMHGGLFISQTPVPGCLAFLPCYCYTLGLNKHIYSAAGSLHAWVQKVHTHCNEPTNNNPEQPFSRQHADQARLSGSLQQVLRH